MSSIKRVAVVSTGTVDIRPQNVRSDGPRPLVVLTSQHWIRPRPINAYLIEHADGLVLFDTGQDHRAVTDPGYFPTGIAGLLNRRLDPFRPRTGPDADRAAGLHRLRHRPCPHRGLVATAHRPY